MKYLLFFAAGITFWVVVFYDIATGSRLNTALKHFWFGSAFGAVCFYLCLIVIIWQTIRCLWLCFRPRPDKRRYR